MSSNIKRGARVLTQAHSTSDRCRQAPRRCNAGVTTHAHSTSPRCNGGLGVQTSEEHNAFLIRRPQRTQLRKLYDSLLARLSKRVTPDKYESEGRGGWTHPWDSLTDQPTRVGILLRNRMGRFVVGLQYKGWMRRSRNRKRKFMKSYSKAKRCVESEGLLRELPYRRYKREEA